MGSDYDLVRVERRIGRRPKKRGVAVLSFGSQAEIEKRLEKLPRTRLRPPAQLQGNPVRRISMDHAAPWSLLPIADCLKDLGPFAIYDPWSCTYYDPSAFRPKRPRPRDPLFTVEHESRGPGVRWSALGADEFSTEAQLHVEGPRLFVTEQGGYATRLDVATGKTRWAIDCGRGYLCSILCGTTLVVGSEHPDLFGIATRDGSLRWKVQVGDSVTTQPVRIDSHRVAVATQGGRVYAVHSREGRRLWAVEAGEWIPALCSGGGLVIAGTARGEVIVIESKTGRSLSRRYVEPTQPSYTPMIKSLIYGDRKLLVRLEQEIQILDLRGLDRVHSVALPYSASRTFQLGDALVDCTPGEDGEWLTTFLDAKSLRERFSLRSPRPYWAAPIAVGRNVAGAIATGSRAGSLELAIVHLGSGRVRSSRTLPVESVQALGHTAHGFVVAAGKRLIAL